jgi:hypothetical protein
MTNPQGTEWETATVNDAKERGIPAIRLVKQSQKNEADVLIGNSHVHPQGWHIPVVFWKRLAPKKRGQAKRQPLGERYVVIIGRDDFMEIMEMLWTENLAPTLWVQNKWAEQISVTRVLKGLRDWLSTRLESL